MTTPTILRPLRRLERWPIAALLCLAVLPGGLLAQEETDTRIERRVQVVFSDDEGNRQESIWVDDGFGPSSILVHDGDDEMLIGAPVMIHTSAYLGVHLLDITPELREHFGATRDTGVLVSGVAEDGPALAAGIQVGDVLTTIDGEEVGRISQVLRKLSRHQEGETVSVGLVRARRSLSVDATLAQRPRSQVDLAPMFWTPGDGERRVLRLPNRVIEIERGDLDEAFSELHERLDSPEWQRKLEETTSRRLSLEARIRELEERLREMEKRLENESP